MKIVVVMLLLILSQGAFALDPACPDLKGLWDDGRDDLDIDIFEDHYLFFNPIGPRPVITDGQTQFSIKENGPLFTAICQNNSLVLRAADSKDEEFIYQRRSNMLHIDHYYVIESGKRINDPQDFPLKSIAE